MAAPDALIVQYQAPKGTPWHGDFLLTDGKMFHITSPADKVSLAKLVPAVDLSYAEYSEFTKSGPAAPVPAKTSGQISTSLVDFSGAGSWASGEAACREYTRQACAIMGIADTAAWANGMATIAGRETSFNSPAWQVNTNDSNAIGAIVSDGHPFQCSRGGWQCIPQTFAANHVAGTSYKIYDPVANVAAAMTYVMRNYGVARDGHNLAQLVQQADPHRSPRGY